MNKVVKIVVITVILTISLLSIVGYVGWEAWKRGVVGNNPKAPLAINMLKIVRRQAIIENRLFDMNDSCLPINLNRPIPERIGIGGIAFKRIPGQHEITMLLETEYADQPKRDFQFKQLDYLVKQGIIDVKNTVVETTEGARPARSYSLTWKGAVLSGQKDRYASFCLSYGRRNFGGILKVEKLLEKYKNEDVYEVTYAIKMDEIPEWAKADEVREYFPEIESVLIDEVKTTKVVRSDVGWRVLNESKPTRSLSAFASINVPIDKELIDKEIKEISVNTINTYIHNNTRDISWIARKMKMCMPISLKASENKMDEKSDGFTVTYFDVKEGKGYEQQKLKDSLHILSALESAGLAKSVIINNHEDNTKNLLKSDQDISITGIRFTIDKLVAEGLRLNKRGSGCIPYGRQMMEILSVKRRIEKPNYYFIARGNIIETPGWVEKIAKDLPSLRLLINNGVLLKGYLVDKSYGEAKSWDMTRVSTYYPAVKYQDIPSYLKPLFPNMAKVMSPKKIRAPRIFSDKKVSRYIPRRFREKGQPMGIPGYLNIEYVSRDVISPVFKSAGKHKIAINPLYPAGKSDVHVISVQNSASKQGRPRSTEHIEGEINLTVTVPDAVLLLCAHEPTLWNVTVKNGYKLAKVIVIGSHEQRVHLNGGGKPEVVVTHDWEIFKRTDLYRYMQITTGELKNDLIDIAKISEAITGNIPASYQASYNAPREGFHITKNTPGFRLPSPLGPGDYLEDEKMIINKNLDKYWSTAEYSSGKIYLEARMHVKNSLSAHARSNLGLCLSKKDKVKDDRYGYTNLMMHGEQLSRKDGDVIGMAVDFDNQRIYYHINGKWMTGKAGSGDGIKLERDKFYRVCADAIYKSNNGDVSSTEWEFSAGTVKYKQIIPSEFTVL